VSVGYFYPLSSSYNEKKCPIGAIYILAHCNYERVNKWQSSFLIVTNVVILVEFHMVLALKGSTSEFRILNRDKKSTE
jgi:hypothetical protein